MGSGNGPRNRCNPGLAKYSGQLPFGGWRTEADKEGPSDDRRPKMGETGKRDIDVKLLELLACPLTKGPLVWDAERGELVSRLARLAYPVRDGIPVMLPSEARQIGEPETNPST